MERYSLDKNQHGYVRKSNPVSTNHRDLHNELNKAGYTYTFKSPEPDFDGKTHHVYSKEAGSYMNPHKVEISTTSKGIFHVSAKQGQKEHD